MASLALEPLASGLVPPALALGLVPLALLVQDLPMELALQVLASVLVLPMELVPQALALGLALPALGSVLVPLDLPMELAPQVLASVLALPALALGLARQAQALVLVQAMGLAQSALALEPQALVTVRDLDLVHLGLQEPLAQVVHLLVDLGLQALLEQGPLVAKGQQGQALVLVQASEQDLEQVPQAPHLAQARHMVQLDQDLDLHSELVPLMA